MLIDSVYRRNKSYYPQACSEEYKYVLKKKTSKFIEDYIEISFNDSDKEDPDNSDEYNSDAEDSNEEN